ncbi:hypothetical protein TWF730_009762 [Orbilia blumenaviensis]|uniref:Caspase domain-containing protein n=1 Tax=Orbilia blumenaviensis TaxID=1796055 RepID=A0AAV9UST5_9PEZI
MPPRISTDWTVNQAEGRQQIQVLDHIRQQRQPPNPNQGNRRPRTAQDANNRALQNSVHGQGGGADSSVRPRAENPNYNSRVPQNPDSQRVGGNVGSGFNINQNYSHGGAVFRRSRHSIISGCSDTYRNNVSAGWKVKVLILAFELTDLGLEPELKQVHESFKGIGYNVETYLIPVRSVDDDSSALHHLWDKIADFASPQPGIGKISYVIYFSGHGYWDSVVNPKYFLVSHNQYTAEKELGLWSDLFEDLRNECPNAIERSRQEARGTVIGEAIAAAQRTTTVWAPRETIAIVARVAAEAAAEATVENAIEATSRTINDVRARYEPRFH